jgi:hypothetical protein
VVSSERFNGHGPTLLPVLISVAALAWVSLLLGVADASAATRFAVPGGDETAGSECLRSTPCSLFNAASLFAPATKLKEGDEVVVEPGNYSDAAGDLGRNGVIIPPANVSIHGVAGRPRPVIAEQGVGGAASAFLLNREGVTLSGLEIHSSLDSRALELTSAGVIDDVVAVSSGRSGACFATEGVIRDSACLSSGDSGLAIEVREAVSPHPTVRLRNVTAIATGAGSTGIDARGFGNVEVNVDAIGLLVRGTVQDVFAGAFRAGQAGPGAKVAVNLDHSDFGQVRTENEAGAGTATATAPGSGTNSTATPLLDADGYHELAGSPTIDAGAVDAASGGIDIDADPRVSGAAADIGADEFPAPPPTGGGTGPFPGPVPVPLPRAPNTSLKKKPARRTASRRASFAFAADQPGARFECKLDKARFRPCRSPFSRRAKPGRHTFQVRAVNGAGAVDPTPASFRWTVLPTGRA